jgi:hypothetical protein
MKCINIEINQKDLVHNDLRLGAGLAKVKWNANGMRLVWRKA